MGSGVFKVMGRIKSTAITAASMKGEFKGKELGDEPNIVDGVDEDGNAIVIIATIIVKPTDKVLVKENFEKAIAKWAIKGDLSIHECEHAEHRADNQDQPCGVSEDILTV